MRIRWNYAPVLLGVMCIAALLTGCGEGDAPPASINGEQETESPRHEVQRQPTILRDDSDRNHQSPATPLPAADDDWHGLTPNVSPFTNPATAPPEKPEPLVPGIPSVVPDQLGGGDNPADPFGNGSLRTATDPRPRPLTPTP